MTFLDKTIKLGQSLHATGIIFRCSTL